MGDQWPYILNFLIYLGVSLPLLILGMVLFLFTTPYKEIQLIREGTSTENVQKRDAAKAAVLDLGGKTLGLSLVIASAIYHTMHVMDLIIWGIVGSVFQVLVFYLLELLTPFRVVSEIPKGNVPVGMFTCFLSIATGLMMATLISY